MCLAQSLSVIGLPARAVVCTGRFVPRCFVEVEEDGRQVRTLVELDVQSVLLVCRHRLYVVLPRVDERLPAWQL